MPSLHHLRTTSDGDGGDGRRGGRGDGRGGGRRGERGDGRRGERGDERQGGRGDGEHGDREQLPPRASRWKRARKRKRR